MSQPKVYRSKALAAVHETVTGIYEAGFMDKKTMREFDALCLTEIKPLSPEEIRKIRTKEYVSQAVFARYLNVTAGLVSKWERGEKIPTGASLKLLTLVQKKGLETIS